MEIKTKFNPEDSVWVMINNKPQQRKVSEIDIICYKAGTNAAYMKATSSIKYSMEGYIGNKWLENEVFSSKEELIKAL